MSNEKKIKHMEKWYEFLYTLETEGGAIVLLLFLLLIFMVPALYSVVWAKEHVVLILGALLGLLKSNIRIKDNDEK